MKTTVGSSSLTYVEQMQRPGQDYGYFMNKAELKKPSFDSKRPRFNYVAQTEKEINKPGPGSYDTPAR